VFYIQEGRVTLTVVSPQGKEAVVAILERAAFLGEPCLAGQLISRMFDLQRSLEIPAMGNKAGSH
jgi:CRP-like cAMP-binding protein